MNSLLGSTFILARLSWLRWCGGLLVVLVACAVRVSVQPYIASGYAPATANGEVIRVAERGVVGSEKALRLDQRAAKPAAKPKRQSHPKRLLPALSPSVRGRNGQVFAARFDSIAADFQRSRLVTPIRKRVPRLGTDEPPWLS